MRTADLVRLLVLAMLWGASFLLLRIVVPSLGVIATAESRVLLAVIALLIWHRVARIPLAWRAHRGSIFVVGVFNSALPFALFAFAARTLPAGYIAIMNATTPMFGALIGKLWLRESLGTKRVLGVLCGIVGVGTLVGLGPVVVDGATLAACAASLLAAASYGFAGNFTKQLAGVIPPTALATGSQLAATIALAPLLLLDPVHHVPAGHVLVAILILAIASTAVAYLLFFRLIRDVGATRALTVTFLIPMFAIAWAWLVLGETPTPRMGIGALMVIAATWLVVSAGPVAAAAPVAARC